MSQQKGKSRELMWTILVPKHLTKALHMFYGVRGTFKKTHCVLMTNLFRKLVFRNIFTVSLSSQCQWPVWYSSTGSQSACVRVLPCMLCSRCLQVYCIRLLSAPQENDTAASGCRLWNVCAARRGERAWMLRHTVTVQLVFTQCCFLN